jgi:hypothetical protein
MSAPRKQLKRVLVAFLILWVLTLGLHVGTMPGGVPVLDTKDNHSWGDFMDGKTDLSVIAFMEVSDYQVGIPCLFTFSGGAMPASLDIAITTDETHAKSTVVIEEAIVTYEDGTTSNAVYSEEPRSGVLSEFDVIDSDRREGKKSYRAMVGIPDCIWKKQDFSVKLSGHITGAEERHPFSTEVGVLYSENSFIYLGWYLLMMRGV